MPDVRDLQQAGEEIERLARVYEDAGSRAVSRSLEVIERAAIEMSSGSMPEALRKQRPFAKRHGAPLVDPGRIFEGTSGIFHQSWQTEGPEWQGDALVGSVFNTDPKAGYLEQRSPPPSATTMFARPIDARIRTRTEPLIDRIFDEEMDRVFSGGG